MATITFNKTNKHILLGIADISASVQELADAIRTFEALLNNFDLKQIMFATGKDDVGGGISTAITLTLLDGWKLNAQARGSPTTVTIFGGNFITDDGTTPFFPITNVTYDRAQSTSSSLLQVQTIENIQRAVEFQNVSAGTGETFYWNPDSGDDLADGLSSATAVKTFVQAHILCTSGQDDIILIEAPDIVGVFTVTENIVFTKHGVHLRGTGRDILLKSSNTTVPTIKIDNVNDIEVSNIEVQSASTGINNAIQVQGLRTALLNITIKNFTGDAINIDGNEGCNLRDLKIIDGDGNGLRINNSKNCFIEDCDISECGKNGIHITADTQASGAHNIIRRSIIRESAEFQVKVGTNVWDLIITPDTFLEPIGLGRLDDNGIVTIDEDQAHHMRTAVNTKRHIETADGEHSGTGETFYWDPFSGDDAETGITEQRAVKTFTRVLQITSSNQHETVIILAKNPAGSTIITERIDLNKNFTFLRGTGRDIIFRPSTTGTTITLSGNGCQLSGCIIESNITGSNNAIDCTGTFPKVNDIWLENATGDGINMTGADNGIFENMFINGVGGDGILVTDSENVTLQNTVVEGSGGDGLDINATIPDATKNLHVIECRFHDNTNFQIDVGINVKNTIIDGKTLILNNGLGRINDNGTGTVDGDTLNQFTNIKTGGVPRRSLNV